MGNIKILEPHIVAKIAAGEVVERPASVVKELLENAFDAKATQIDIDIEESGLTKIQITDNGSGMGEEDIMLCSKPHATSKIETDDDLYSITTLGFRGEALASILAVSEVTISSRHQDFEHGSKVTFRNKKPVLSPLGMPVGTRITVENLFENVPARKKFLKHARTEWQHILHVVTGYALAYPEAGLRLSHNEKIILNLPQKQTLQSRIQHILGEDTIKNMIPLSSDNITGFIGNPQIAVPGSGRQYIFINKRAVTYSPFAKALKRAYGTLIAPTHEPTFVLYITIPPEQIDINIHPRKETVRVTLDRVISQELFELVSHTLLGNDTTYRFGTTAYALQDAPMHPYTAKTLREQTKPWDPRVQEKSTEVLQIHNLYLLFETKAGMQIVDQHAAHERILYEQFLESFNTHKEKKRSILLPQEYSFSVTPKEADHFDGLSQTLHDLGFEFTIKERTVSVSKIPEIFKERDISKLLLEVMEDSIHGLATNTPDDITHKTLSYLACRSAIKTGDPLAQEERKALIKKLLETKTNYTCPHGRPTHIEVSLGEFHKLFKRT